MTRRQRTQLSGWGLTPRARTDLVRAGSEDEIRRLLAKAPDRGIALRGLGRSYGDAAQRSGGSTVVLRTSNVPRWVDGEPGVARVPSHATFADIIEWADPHGYFVPVTPGTRHVTLAGALAADVHGKDHHVAGSIGSHVVRLRLMLANGDVTVVSLENDPDLFRATIGGMGLTGVILEADLRLIRVPGHQIAVETYRTANLEETMDAMTSSTSHRYSVAWIDLMARGGAMGRGVVTNGEHTRSAGSTKPLASPRLSVPNRWPFGLVNRPGIRAFNEAWFRRAPARRETTVESYDRFFYPLDMVHRWNLLYGPRGFLQYQFAVPFTGERHIPKIVDRISRSGYPTFLAVLKRFGASGVGYLSFPMPGWTLAMDIPIPSDPRHLEQLLASCDELVLETGGRIYLAKDSRLGARHLGTMYESLDRFREVRDRVDPDRRLRTDLSERVGL